MHERSLVRALLSQVERLVADHDGERVVRIEVSLGEFSGVDAELFRLAFEELKIPTRLSSAELAVQKTGLEGRCEQCGRQFPIRRFQFECLGCGCRRVTILRGEELMLESVTLEGLPA